jgi:4-diphosphocytidyl-2-C-methyl-D-erythritol kinase
MPAKAGIHDFLTLLDPKPRHSRASGNPLDIALMLRAFAPAKVNLFLHVTGKRADGYHLLDSLAVFPNTGDKLAAAPAPTLSLTIAGTFAAALQNAPDNLILRAARLLWPEGGAALHLEKNLPVASGIGGGSADAAATLRLLNHLWNIEIPPDLAAKLGADVPVCLASRPTLMRSIGEILLPAPVLPSFGILLVNPGAGVATPAIFAARAGAFSAPASLPAGWDTAQAMAQDLATLKNDLQAPAIALNPIIGDVLTTLSSLPGALLTRMSGSGATCFALFATPQEAAEAATAIPNPTWWRWGGGLYEPHPADL